VAAIQSALASGFGSFLTVAYPSNVAAGSLLVVAVASRADTTSTIDFGLANNTFVKAVDTLDTFGPTTWGDLWYADPATVAAGDCQPTSGSGGPTVSISMAIGEWAGVASTPLDKTATGTNFSTTASTGATATTTQASELLVAMIGNEGAGRTITWDVAYSELQDGGTQTSVSLAERSVSSTGAYAVGNSTISGANSVWVACLATFKTGSATPPTPSLGCIDYSGSRKPRWRV